MAIDGIKGHLQHGKLGGEGNAVPRNQGMIRLDGIIRADQDARKPKASSVWWELFSAQHTLESSRSVPTGRHDRGKVAVRVPSRPGYFRMAGRSSPFSRAQSSAVS